MDKPIIIGDIASNWKISNNNEVNFKHTLNIIDEAAKAGFNYVKFQCWNTDEFINERHPNKEQVRAYELPVDWYLPLYNYCKGRDIGFIKRVC